MNTAFQQHLTRLSEYRRTHGHCYLWKTDADHRDLRRWLRQQLTLHKRGHLESDKLEALKALNVDFEACGTHWDRWEERYLALVVFAEEHGHTNVSQLVPGLGPWLSAQRVMYRQKTLPIGRQKLLERIGVEWEPGQKKACRWLSQFNKLERFLRQHGHCNVSRRKYPDPGIWVSAQRTAYRKGILNPERIALLNEAGFQWNLRPGVPKPPKVETNPWMERYHAIRQHKGRCLTEELADWLAKQRTAASKGALMPERKVLLARLQASELDKSR